MLGAPHSGTQTGFVSFSTPFGCRLLGFAATLNYSQASCHTRFDAPTRISRCHEPVFAISYELSSSKWKSVNRRTRRHLQGAIWLLGHAELSLRLERSATLVTGRGDSMQPRLVIISGCSQGRVELLLGDKISIGRDATNQICVIDPAVSRRHCLLTSVDGGYEIADLDSHNGTFVNGVPVQRKQLQNGDTIRMGTCELVFLLSEDEVTSASEAELIGTPATFSLKTVHLEPPLELPVGRMARDLEALFRISNAINSIRELVPLQQELLRLAFEVIPAENGAILLLTNPDDREPTSVCTWHRQADSGEPVQIQSELVQRALWECSAIVSSAGPDSSARQSLCVPLVGVDRTIGVVYLNSPASARCLP